MDSIKLTLDAEQPTPENEQNIIDAEVVEPKKNTLTLTDEDGVIAEVQETPESICDLLERDLTPEQVATVESFVPQIDLRNSAIIDNYAIPTQKKLNNFTQQITEKAKAQDLGIVGLALASLTEGLEDYDPTTVEFPEPLDEKSIAFKLKNLFGDARKAFAVAHQKALAESRTRFNTAEQLVLKAQGNLENHVLTLSTDIKNFGKFEEVLLNYMRELTMYIVAGKRRLDQFNEQELPKLEAEAQQNGPSSQAAQVLSIYKENATLFDKQLHDLMLSREVAAQTLIMSMMIRNNARTLRQKINSTINLSIPLWRNQMVLHLGIKNSQAAVSAVRKANDYTNYLLQKNARDLGQATVDIARENERAIVDIETLKQTHKSLLNTVDEVIKIQSEGAAKRKAAETELALLEKETRAKYSQLYAQKFGA